MSKETLAFDDFESVLADLRAGRMIVMVDDEGRENEGDIVVPTEALTAAHVDFMIREARGLVCVSIGHEVAAKLNLPLQTTQNNSAFHTAFTVSVDHSSVARLGEGAEARATTMTQLIADHAQENDFVVPGRVFPLVANPAGTLGRDGQTEGSFDIARLAGFKASGVICEILDEDGTMARGDRLIAFAKKHDLKITSVEEVKKYRIKNEVLIRLGACKTIHTAYGDFEATVFQDDVEGKEHIALTYGLERFDGVEDVLVRLHSECLTGDVFGSRRCDCGPQLDLAQKMIRDAGVGIILYLRQEGRGIGLLNKLRAYELQDQGHDTVDANLKLGLEVDARDYAVSAKILAHLGVSSVRLLTNNPDKIDALKRFGVVVSERVPAIVPVDEYSKAYINTKRERLGHLL
ncbi:MAG: GTP cyclohydrolase II [Bdellovibrionales bacterium]|nr:GTP cyclohydrolase II [Bdellovibrionales bacterium]